MYAAGPGGALKKCFLGYSASEQQAAERVSAAAYVLGDRYGRTTCGGAEPYTQQAPSRCSRCGGLAHPFVRLRRCRSKVPLGRFSNLAPAQGLAGGAPLGGGPVLLCRCA